MGDLHSLWSSCRTGGEQHIGCPIGIRTTGCCQRGGFQGISDSYDGRVTGQILWKMGVGVGNDSLHRSGAVYRRLPGRRLIDADRYIGAAGGEHTENGGHLCGTLRQVHCDQVAVSDPGGVQSTGHTQSLLT